ncbi:septal ring lytic transglycosylase RlpA family protein [Burkholderiaceae bacterium DAT-1]|nr:septal ring lytic transglycosylase RlpA family protein [Burkholderiaceae bacterium DAT-1]
MRGLRSLSLCSTLVLAACATSHYTPPVTVAPIAPDPSAPAQIAGKPAVPPAKPGQSLKSGKGYYKDDGPIADVPFDLDSLEEPTPRLEVLNRFANKPYTVLGQTFTPMTDIKPFTQRGVASWYGRKFHGQRTSSGEPYDMFQLTAAHPTLPIPSYARVTNLQSGKSVVVRVNDRGPFLKDRVMDLSYAAAYRLGYHAIGSAAVQVDLLMADGRETPAPVLLASADPLMKVLKQDIAQDQAPPPAIPAAITSAIGPDTVWLQLGAFSTQAAADTFKARVQSDLDWLNAPVSVVQGDKVWRVRLGPYDNRDSAKGIITQIAARSGLKPVIVR